MEPNAIATTLYVPVQAADLTALMLSQQFDGFTHWTAHGGWRNPSTGFVEHEEIAVFRAICLTQQWSEQVWRTVASSIRAGFDQHEVLFESTPCRMVLVKD